MLTDLARQVGLTGHDCSFAPQLRIIAYQVYTSNMTGLFTYRNFSLEDTEPLDGKVAVITVRVYQYSSSMTAVDST